MTKRLIALFIAAAVVLAPAVSEAACGKRLVRGARRAGGAVLRFILPPYGR